jgi:hypothetical protein
MKRIIPFSMFIILMGALLSASAGTLTIIKPDGGEKIKTGTTFPIEWSYDNAPEKDLQIILLLYRDGIKFRAIVDSAPNTGRYLWKIPSDIPAGKKYRIRIRSKQDLSVNDFSNSDFSILSEL